MAKRLTKQDVEQRQTAFEKYRDLGRGRSVDKVLIVLEPIMGWLPKSRVIQWCKDDHWVERVAEYDRLLDPNDELPAIESNADFDRMDLLAKSAYLALSRALKSHPSVRTPQDYKALVDSAEKAIRCMEKLRELGTGKSKPAELAGVKNAAKEIFDMLTEATRQRFAAQGTPVQVHGGPIIDVEAVDVTPEQPDTEAVVDQPKALAAPSEEPVVSAVVEKPRETEKAMAPKTMAERLASMRR